MTNVRSITPLPPADFTPEIGNYKTLKPFRYWCQKVLPLVYDDSLSYYELLCKVIDYLNKTMEDVETLHGDITNLHKAYTQLQEYVNNYFSTLDVQEEINKKLDEMAKDGTLDAIINNFLTSNLAEIGLYPEIIMCDRTGTTDVTDIIQEKLNENKYVLLPKGKYKITTLNLNQYNVLYGLNPYTTEIHFTGNIGVNIPLNADHSVIKNIKIIGNDSGDCISIGTSGEASVQDIGPEITNCICSNGNNGIYLRSGRDTRISNCTATLCKNYGFLINATDCIIDKCVANYCEMYGFNIMGANNKISGCKAFLCGTIDKGAGFHFQAAYLLVEHCDSQQNYRYNYHFQNSLACSFINLTSDLAGYQNDGFMYSMFLQGCSYSTFILDCITTHTLGGWKDKTTTIFNISGSHSNNILVTKTYPFNKDANDINSLTNNNYYLCNGRSKKDITFNLANKDHWNNIVYEASTNTFTINYPASASYLVNSIFDINYNIVEAISISCGFITSDNNVPLYATVQLSYTDESGNHVKDTPNVLVSSNPTINIPQVSGTINYCTLKFIATGNNSGQIIVNNPMFYAKLKIN